MACQTRLIYADSERDPDMLYATGFFVPDAFVFLEHREKRIVCLSDLEVDRARKQADVDEVLAVSDILKRLKLPSASPVGVWLPLFLKQKKIKELAVPQNFPLGLARHLETNGVRLELVEGLFWASRESKTPHELRHLKRALQITAAGIARGVEVLSSSSEGVGRKLIWGGSVLTSERLRAEIDSAVLHAGGQPANTIVAGGLQACDPHERGSGPLRGGELIILDVFPRDSRSGFYGDMTRTVVRGRATDAQRHLWETVRAGQRYVLKAMRPGLSGKQLHEEVRDYFSAQGFPTEQHKGRWRGFFHGTGHGLGLEIHEAPRFGATEFKIGQVMTVEPGIYWPGVGGARIEDVVVVTSRGIKVLSEAPVILEV
jgi:Xaa-Pro aminopeptidase